MIDLAQLPMRVGLGQFNELTDERLTFIKQCGCDDFLVNTPKLPGHEKWEFADLARWKAKADEAGLRWMAIENVPRTFYDEIMLGRPGRERQLANMCETVRNMGQVGIPILGYNFMPNLVWRTSRETPGRGGALATSYDDSIASQATLEDQPRYTSAVDVADREYTEEEMWDNYDWYLERILPVCEESGVQFALHPDDPPVKSSLGCFTASTTSLAHSPSSTARFMGSISVTAAGRKCAKERACSTRCVTSGNASDCSTFTFATCRGRLRISPNVSSAKATAIRWKQSAHLRTSASTVS